MTTSVAAAIVLALAHSPNVADLLLGLLVGAIVVAIRFVRRRGASDVILSAEPTTVFVRSSVALARRRMACLRTIRLVMLLGLLFFVPWWLDGFGIHGRPSVSSFALSFLLPAAGMLTIIFWTSGVVRGLGARVEHLRRERKWMGVPLVLLLLVSGGCVDEDGEAPAGSGRAPTVGFVDVNIVPMTPGDSVLAARTVIVRDGRIVDIGSRDEVVVSTESVVVDGTGRYLIPGLADMHVHLEYFEDPELLSLFLANGVTTVRNMDGRPYILEWRDRIVAGSLLGPTIHTAGPILDGDPPILDDNTVVATAEAASEAVRAQAAAGYDFVKVYTGLAPEPYRAILETAADLELPVAGHVPRDVGVEDAIALGQYAIEHIAEYGELVESDRSPVRDRWHWSKLHLAMPVDPEKATAVAQWIATTSVWSVPTPAQSDRALAPDDSVEAWLADPEMDLLPRRATELWRRDMDSRTERLDAQDWAVVERGRRNRRMLLDALRRAGANLTVGTDTPNPFVVPGYALHESLAVLRSAGFTPRQALSTVSLEAARFLRELHLAGTVEVGKRADLVLLEADPLQDLSTLREPSGVMVRGRWLPRERLDAMLEDLRVRR